jgi:hypothetical protein
MPFAIKNVGRSYDSKELTMPFRNESNWDRVIRILAAVVLAYVAWATWPGTVAILSLVVGAILLVTGFAGWCAAYALLGFSTRKKIGA